MSEQDAGPDAGHKKEFFDLCKAACEYARSTDASERWDNESLLAAWRHPYREVACANETDFFKGLAKGAAVSGMTFNTFRSWAKASEFANRAAIVTLRDAEHRKGFFRLSYGGAVALRVYTHLEDDQLLEVLRCFYSLPDTVGVRQRKQKVFEQFPQPKLAEGQQLAGRKRRQVADADEGAEGSVSSAEVDSTPEQEQQSGRKRRQVADADTEEAAEASVSSAGEESGEEEQQFDGFDAGFVDLDAQAARVYEQDQDSHNAVVVELAAEKNKYIDLSAAFSRLQAQLTDSETALTAEQKKKDELSTKVGSLETQLTDSETALTAEQKKKDELSTKVGSLETQLTDSDTALTAVQKKKDDLSLKIGSLNTQLNDAARVVAAVQQQKNELSLMVGSLNAQLSDSARALTAEKQKNQVLSDELAAEKQRYQHLKAKYDKDTAALLHKVKDHCARATKRDRTQLPSLAPPDATELPAHAIEYAVAPCGAEFAAFIPNVLRRLRWNAQPAALSHKSALEQLTVVFRAALDEYTDQEMVAYAEAIKQLKESLQSETLTMPQVHRQASSFPRGLFTHAEFMQLVLERPKQQQAEALATPAAAEGAAAAQQ